MKYTTHKIILFCFSLLMSVKSMGGQTETPEEVLPWYNTPAAWWTLGGILFALLLMAFMRYRNRKKN